MASITINPVNAQISLKSTLTGDEKILVINKSGKASTIEVNQILDKVDDEIIDRIDDQVMDKIEDSIDDLIDDRLDNIDPNKSFNWNEVL